MNTLPEYDLLVGGLRINYLKVEPNSKSVHVPTIVSLHGGGTGDKYRTRYLLDPLVESGARFVALDFSGHGKSEGTLAQSSLARRVSEAMAIIGNVCSDRPFSLMGSSMGGHVALELLKKIGNEKVKNLILFCPALYTAESFNVPFGNGFSDMIRKPSSYRNANAHLALKTYNGGFLLVQGERDEIIPKDVTSMISECCVTAQPAKVIMLEGCGHLVHTFLKDNHEAYNNVINVILNMLGLTFRQDTF